MENLEAIVRVGKEIGLTEEELQSWVKEKQDFCIGEQKWCKDMIELKEKRLMIQAEEIKELKDTVEKMKEESDNIEKRHRSEIQKMKEALVNMNEVMSKKEENEPVEKKNVIQSVTEEIQTLQAEKTDLQNKYSCVVRLCSKK